MRKEYILYLGNYLDEQIVQKRGLPSHNVAGTNRIHRISKALNNHFNTIVLSPGTSMRIKKNKRLFLSSKFSRVNGVKVFYVKTMGIPYVTVLYSFIAYIVFYFKFLNRTKAKNIIVYNFDPNLVSLVLLTKLFYPKVNICNNIEDVSVPNISDFKRKSEERGFQQLVFYICMKLIARLSNSYILPTKKFIKYLPKKENIIIVTGCITVSDKVRVKNQNDVINILFAGKIAFEHGIYIFIDCLKKLEKTEYQYSIKIDISGGGDKSKWLADELTYFKKLRVNYHGFVSNDMYKTLLDNADVCVALQKDDGRHAQLKTPSKVYEYIGNAKLVIATDVGDLSEINSDYVRICKPLTALYLKELIRDIIENKSKIDVLKSNIQKYALNNYDSKVVGSRLYYFLNA